jgi:hypothetical protein
MPQLGTTTEGAHPHGTAHPQIAAIRLRLQCDGCGYTTDWHNTEAEAYAQLNSHPTTKENDRA